MKYKERMKSIQMIDAHFVKLGYRRVSILRKVISPYFGIGKTKFYSVINQEIKLENMEKTNHLFEFGKSMGEAKLTKRDLI